jgi:hypothetical protein
MTLATALFLGEMAVSILGVFDLQKGDKTEAAYARGDALAKRRRLMDQWARYCTSGAAAMGKVVPLRKR